MNNPIVPVIMHHSVGIVNNNWLSGHLTCPWKLFEKHLSWLKRLNIHTITLQELYDYKKNNFELPERSVILTFDDGYLDNWVFVYPLLKKYSYKGVIFVNPEFVDSKNIVRNNLEDVWNNNVALDSLKTEGFLSWDEMKIMESEGVIDIQSHSMSHTWYFTSDKIIDFHSPGKNRNPWICWNNKPERKSYYFTENQEDYVPYGMPVYENGRSLGIRRYFECEHLNDYLVNFIKENGIEFFNEKNWANALLDQVILYRSHNKLTDRYETLEEQKERYKYELRESKNIIEKKLSKRVDFLCWPGGANNDSSVKMSFDEGYIAYTVSAVNNMGGNTSSEDPAIIYRIGPPNVQRNGKIYYLGGVAFILRYFAFKNNLIARILQKCMRLMINMLVDLRVKRDGIVIRK